MKVKRPEEEGFEGASAAMEGGCSACNTTAALKVGECSASELNGNIA